MNVNVAQSKVQAGRLLVAAIDGGAFPESLCDVNGQWWDRGQGRVPGGPFAVLGGIRWKAGDPSPFAAPDYLAAARRSWDAAQFAAVWTFAIGSWLVKAFPDRFRHGAAEYDWLHVATDREGYPVDKDGKRILARWYRNGRPLPRGFVWRPGLRGKYQWRGDGQLVDREELYDESDWLAHLRIRAEVYSDACLVLAVLIGPKKDDADLPDLPVQYVTRSQAAAIVNRSPRTFEHYTDMPKPAVPGGKGRPAEWEWPIIRPWLERTFGRRLPVRFPADSFTRK